MYPCMTKSGCPENNNPKRGRMCPAWIEGDLCERDLQTGDIKQTKGCFFVIIPRMLLESIAASHQPASEISAMRQETTLAMVRASERLIMAAERKLLGKPTS